MAKNLTPHDVFFKQIFSQREILSGALSELLPEDVARRMDFDSLAYLPGESVGEGLSRSTRADLVFSVSFGEREGRLVVILEHKSHPDPRVHFQILQMMVMGWMQNLREGREPLPILPILFYHGQGPWNLPDLFSERMNLPREIARYLPDFELLRIDLGLIDDTRLRSLQNVLAGAALLSMKHVFENPRRFFHLLIEFGRERSAPHDIIEKIVLVALDYAGHVHKNIPDEELYKIMAAITEEAGMETTTERLKKIWIEEGIQKGVQQGVQQTQSKTILSLSQHNFTPQQIADLLSLDLPEVERVLAQQ